jgi:hypothetical protein
MMMKTTLLACVVSTAVAFTPSSSYHVPAVATTSTALNEFCNGYIGSDGPEPMFVGATGSKNFDPAGLTEVWDQVLSTKELKLVLLITIISVILGFIPLLIMQERDNLPVTQHRLS